MKTLYLALCFATLALALPTKRQDASDPGAATSAFADFQTSVGQLQDSANNLQDAVSTAGLSAQDQATVSSGMSTLNQTMIQLASATDTLSQSLGGGAPAPAVDGSGQAPTDDGGDDEGDGADGSGDGGDGSGDGTGDASGAPADAGAAPAETGDGSNSGDGSTDGADGSNGSGDGGGDGSGGDGSGDGGDGGDGAGGGGGERARKA